jgi:hypothetical protein
MRKRSLKYLFYFSIAVAILLGMSCRKSPTDWNTSWTAPIGNGRITLEDIIGNENLAIDEWGWYHLVIDTTVSDFGWDDIVQIEDTTITKAYFMPFTLDVPPGVSIINQFQNESFLNTGSAALRKLYLKSGKLKYKIYNYINGQIQCTYELPTAFVNGVPLQVNAVAYPGSASVPFVLEGEVDLAGCQMDLSGPNGFSVNELKSHIVIQTDPNSSQDAQVSAGDQVKVEMELVDPVVSYAKGYFGMQTRTFDREIALLTGVKSGHAQFGGGFVQLDVANFIGVDAFFQLDSCRYYGVNGEQTELIHPMLGVNQTLSRATETSFGISPTHWLFDIGEANSNIIECMETLPNRMKIKAKATFNPFGNINAYNDFIDSDNIVSVRMVTDIPMRMAFQDVVLESKIALDFSNESIQQGSIHVRLTNAFPMQVEANVYAGEISSAHHLGKIELPSAPLDASTWEAIPQPSSFEIQCTEQQLEELRQQQYLTVQWVLNTLDYPNLVGFRPGYYLDAVSVGNAEINVVVGNE